MAKLIDNASGNVNRGITLTSIADSYKLRFNCSNIGSGKSFIRIYATLSDTSCKTYFFPIQFLNENEIEFSLDGSTTAIQFDMIGNATVTDITLEEVTNATMEYVKANSTYWDRIKEVTSNTGKLRAEAMEGILNLALNAFANSKGTITQEDGVMTFMNGTSPEDSTQAVMITGGAIMVSNRKDESGSWLWSTAITGSGINADTITSGTLNAISILGSAITGGTITGGSLTSVTIEGSNIYAGDRANGTYIEITSDGYLNAYKKHKKTLNFGIYNSGTITLGTDIDGFDGAELDVYSNVGIEGKSYAQLEAKRLHGIALTCGSTTLYVNTDGVFVNGRSI